MVAFGNDPVPAWCWPSVEDAGPTPGQHWVRVRWVLGSRHIEWRNPVPRDDPAVISLKLQLYSSRAARPPGLLNVKCVGRREIYLWSGRPANRPVPALSVILAISCVSQNLLENWIYVCRQNRTWIFKIKRIANNSYSILHNVLNFLLWRLNPQRTLCKLLIIKDHVS